MLQPGEGHAICISLRGNASRDADLQVVSALYSGVPYSKLSLYERYERRRRARAFSIMMLAAPPARRITAAGPHVAGDVLLPGGGGGRVVGAGRRRWPRRRLLRRRLRRRRRDARVGGPVAEGLGEASDGPSRGLAAKADGWGNKWWVRWRGASASSEVPLRR